MLGTLVFPESSSAISLSSELDAKARSLIVKSAYLLGMINYVEFPGEPIEKFTLCLLENDAIWPHLEKTYLSKPDIHSNINILTLNSKAEVKHRIKKCHFFYFTEQSTIKSQEFNDLFAKNLVLSISDTPDYIEMGGAIGFVEKVGKILLELNMSRIATQGISVNPKLIEIAARVI